MSDLPETLDRQQVVDAIGRRITADVTVVSARLGADEFPTATVRIGDFPDNEAIAEAVGIDHDGVGWISLDHDGAVVTTIDGETHRIPFADTIEETP